MSVQTAPEGQKIKYKTSTFIFSVIVTEPRHEKTFVVVPYANNKGADQPAHSRNLISAFEVSCLDSIIPLVSISEISSLSLASIAAQAGLSLPWSKTPKTDFLVTRLI